MSRSGHRWARGQAMVEYALLTWLLVVGLVFGATVRIFPHPSGVAQSLVDVFALAFKAYHRSLAHVLRLPFP